MNKYVIPRTNKITLYKKPAMKKFIILNGVQSTLDRRI